MTLKSILHRLNRRDLPLFPKYIKVTLIILSVVCAIFLTKRAIATDPTTGPDLYLQKQSAISDGNNQESWLNEAMGSNLVTIYSGLNGDMPAEVIDSFKKTGYVPRFVPQGAIGTINKYIASLFTPPASGIQYIAQVKDTLLGKPAYAQGVGFKGLEFLLPLWRGFRNVTYVLASLIFVALGLMIILRIKISPQAVITIQSAIPQVITSLVLVTFSYAIAGLIIDVGNLLLGLVIALLFSVNGRSLTDSSIFGSWWANGTGFPGLSDIGNLLSNIGGTFSFKGLADPNLRTLQILTYRALPGSAASMMLGGLLGSIIVGFFLGGVGNFFAGAGGSFLADMSGRAIGGILGGVIGFIILPLIFSIVACIWLIKLYFGLFTTYVTLIFKIIIGPLEIALGAFPNSKMGFGSWFRDVAAYVAVFPVITIFLVLLNLIVDAVAGGTIGSSRGLSSPAVWAPGLISSGGISPSILAAAIGLAGLALLSKLPSMVPEFIFMIKPSPWGKAIGEGLGDIGKPAKFAAQAGGEYVGDVIDDRRTASKAMGVLGYGVDAARSLGILKKKNP